MKASFCNSCVGLSCVHGDVMNSGKAWASPQQAFFPFCASAIGTRRPSSFIFSFPSLSITLPNSVLLQLCGSGVGAYAAPVVLCLSLSLFPPHLACVCVAARILERQRRIVGVVSGDTLASPTSLLQHLRAQWRTAGVLQAGGEERCLVLEPRRKDVREAGSAEPATDFLHITFQLLTSPPQTLVTDVDAILLGFSPSHPLSFQHLGEVWWPIFVHLRRLPLLLVVAEMKLLVMPEAQRSMRERCIQQISVHDVASAAQPTAVPPEHILPVPLGRPGPLYANTRTPPGTLLAHLCNTLLCTCGSVPGGETQFLPLQLRWEATPSEAAAFQLEA
ncbi:uncharacterized protein Tco025E_00585 [Trypanosoma conorhini]|uniref:Uncharacterized protein n=1 Tax=Trypanosoma conorhini TaxID=83891 RepID=A0A422QB12_9TRYP|nr:uncharacterized protein Tco025E_00585 [Trypanosoma conorhini]RNF27148.1 hypothetical protein Tco025E_00585 [Trypanosoma conorhini]